jgi:pyrroline-5-carboxylate reductase
LNNAEAVREAPIIILAVKPRWVESVINEIKDVLDYDRQMIVSVAAGVTFEQLLAFLDKQAAPNRRTPPVFRVIPNMAMEVFSSMTFLSACHATKEQTDRIRHIFGELGNVMTIDERLMTAGTALASSGIAFALRYMRAAIEGGVELGFNPREAQDIVAHTVKGAVNLLLAKRTTPEQEIDRVATSGGITIRGLNEMELSGFTSAVIRGLKAK